MAVALAPHYGALGGAAKPPPVLDQVQWCEPTPALPHGHADVLTPQQVRQWHEQRFVCVDGIWPADLIARVVDLHVVLEHVMRRTAALNRSAGEISLVI